MSQRRQNFRKSVSGIVILGEGITEKFYFKHLKNIKGYYCTIVPRFFNNTSMDEMENRILEALRGDVTVICVFDADVTVRNDSENQKLKTLRLKYKGNENIIFCDSLRTIEYWFLLHFKDTCHNYPNSEHLLRDLKRHIINYEKKTTFLDNEKWVRDMTLGVGNFGKAMKRAVKYSDGTASYTKIYLAIHKLNETIE